MEKRLTPSYPSKAVFPPCQCEGMRQHEEEMVAAAAAPLFLAGSSSLPLTMLRRHVGVLLWLPSNPETAGNGDGWDDGLRGRWSPSKLPSVIKTIHSHLCVNRKQKRGFFFLFI